MRILVATDLSARSDRAVARAVKLARAHRAALHVIHVHAEDLSGEAAVVVAATAAEQIRQQLRVAALPRALKAAVEVCPGQPWKTLFARIETLAPDLLVIGSPRPERIADMFLGTVAARVLRLVSVPVLIVKQPSAGPYRKILVAVDFSTHCRRALEAAIALNPNAAFHLVHAFDVPLSGFAYPASERSRAYRQHRDEVAVYAEQAMCSFVGTLKQQPRRMRHSVLPGFAAQVLAQHLKRELPDLLVTGTHGRTGVGYAVLGSQAEELIRAANCDILAARAW